MESKHGFASGKDEKADECFLTASPIAGPVVSFPKHTRKAKAGGQVQSLVHSRRAMQIDTRRQVAESRSRGFGGCM
jgi:hypothetical protein